MHRRRYMPNFAQMAADQQEQGNRVYPWNSVERELRRQEKVLRDHNLYMGPMEAFQNEYQQGTLTVKR